MSYYNNKTYLLFLPLLESAVDELAFCVNVVMASPSFLPWLVQDSKFISTPEGETQRGYTAAKNLLAMQEPQDPWVRKIPWRRVVWEAYTPS